MTPQPVKAEKEYPYQDGDTIVLGPEIFASVDEKTVAWKGQNYEKQEAKAEAAEPIKRLDVDISLLGSDDWKTVCDQALDNIADALSTDDLPPEVEAAIELAMKKGVRLAAGLNV